MILKHCARFSRILEKYAIIFNWNYYSFTIKKYYKNKTNQLKIATVQEALFCHAHAKNPFEFDSSRL